MQYLPSVRFDDSENDTIIVAGQMGQGPCDTTSPDPGHGLCEFPPQTSECVVGLDDWISNLPTGDTTNAIYAFSGGAGGGGASYVGHRTHVSPFLVVSLEYLGVVEVQV